MGILGQDLESGFLMETKNIHHFNDVLAILNKVKEWKFVFLCFTNTMTWLESNWHSYNRNHRHGIVMYALESRSKSNHLNSFFIAFESPCKEDMFVDLSHSND